METIIAATNNSGKLKEFQKFSTEIGINILPSSSVNSKFDIEETGLTFIENALLKARALSKMTDFPVLADDSGLCVPILKNAPGLYSARYSGINSNDEDNNNKLLSELQNHGFPQKAYYYCCLLLLRHTHDPNPIIAEGFWHGEIIKTTQGKNGFGYDPIFFIPSLAKTAAQLTTKQKNDISHRGQALKKIMLKLKEINKKS